MELLFQHDELGATLMSPTGLREVNIVFCLSFRWYNNQKTEYELKLLAKQRLPLFHGAGHLTVTFELDRDSCHPFKKTCFIFGLKGIGAYKIALIYGLIDVESMTTWPKSVLFYPECM